MNEKIKFDELVNKSSNILITSHKNPDPDAVCSTLAIYSYIKKYHPKKGAKIVMSTSTFSPEWNYAAGIDNIEWVEDIADYLKGVDLVIFLDGNQLSRFSSNDQKIDLKDFKSICIDHHPGEPDNFNLNLSDVSSSATCQIIADILFDSKSKPSKDVAETLLIGILSDSGSFRFVTYENSSVLETAKRLIDVAKTKVQTLQLKVDQIDEIEIDLMKTLLENTTNVKLKKLPGMTYSFLPKSVLPKDINDNIVSDAHHRYMFYFLRLVKDHPWGFVVIPRPDGVFRISFRSTPGAPNVRLLANEFDGGGHDLAAGGKYVPDDGEENLDAEDICKKVLNTIMSTKVELTST